MIDTSGKSFADFQNRLDARIATIVKMTRGSDVWYLGDIEIEWGAGIHVYGILTSYTGMKRATDPFRKKWSVGEVTLTFSNLPFKKDSSGNWLRPSDDINVREIDPVEIYLLCGENATGLSDCILKFSGLLKEPAKFDEHTWSITVVDRSIYLLNQMIPTKTVESVYSDAPDEFKEDVIPIVYGEFIYTITDYNWGLAKGIPINSDVPPKCVFSDHQLKQFHSMYHQENDFDESSKYINVTLNPNDSGRGTGTPNAKQIAIYISPENTDYGNHIPPGYTQDPDNADRAYDKDYATYAESMDYDDNGSLMKSRGCWSFSFNKDELLEGLINKAITKSGGTSGVGIRYKISPSSGITFNHEELCLGSVYLTSTSWPSETFDGIIRETSLDQDSINISPARKIYVIMVDARSSSGADGTTYNKYIAKIFELWLHIVYDYPGGDIQWGRLKGRTFGSWIDGAGHLINDQGYDAGDLIEDPAYIIESILRDELSWATANIDEASFDAAANTSVIMRMNLTKKATVAKIIRQICEQSTFMFHINSAGKARLIPLNESSPTTDRTIPFSHIKANTLRASGIGPFINWLTFNSCWLPQLQKYRSVGKGYDGGSLSNYGIHENIVYWPNIEGSSVSHVYGHLLGAVNGLWSNPKKVIELETVGFTNADVEIGDWIELDDETWDAQLKQAGGTSWSGEQFLVTEVTQKQDGTRIKAIAI